MTGLIEGSETTICVLFPLENSGDPYSFTFPTMKSTNRFPGFLSMRECRETYEYPAFVPRENVFEGPIFGRYHGNRTYFETKVKKYYLLYIRSPLAESWIRVKYALLALIPLFYTLLRPLTAPP